MAKHIDLGKQGEQLAEAWLVKKGFTILHRNWRHAPYEVDLIALHAGQPHFIEVKMRSSAQFGLPEDRVDKKKLMFLLKAVDAFLFTHPAYTDFRIDILSICHWGGRTEYFMIEDIYL